MSSATYATGLIVLSLVAFLTWNVSLVLTGQPYFPDTYRNVLWASLIGQGGSSRALGASRFTAYPSEWPGAWIFGSILLEMTGMSGYQLAVVFPLLFTALVLLFFEFLVRCVFEERTDRFVAFAMLLGLGGANFESLFSASALSTLLAIPFLACLARQSGRTRFACFLFAVAIVVVHPVMPIMLSFGMGCYLLFGLVSRYLKVGALDGLVGTLDAPILTLLLTATVGYFLLATVHLRELLLTIAFRLEQYVPVTLFSWASPFTPSAIMDPLTKIVYYGLYVCLLLYLISFLRGRSRSIGIFRLFVICVSIFVGSEFLLPTLFPQGFGGRWMIMGSLIIPIATSATGLHKKRAGRVFMSSFFILLLVFSVLAVSSSAPRSVYGETNASLYFGATHSSSYGVLEDPSRQSLNAIAHGRPIVTWFMEYYDASLIAQGRVDTIVFSREVINTFDTFDRGSELSLYRELTNSRYNLVLCSGFAYLYMRPSFSP